MSSVSITNRVLFKNVKLKSDIVLLVKPCDCYIIFVPTVVLLQKQNWDKGLFSSVWSDLCSTGLWA